MPSRSATPPCGLTPRAVVYSGLLRVDPCTRADDETRTRDPNLGKVVRYQLRYIRVGPAVRGASMTLADAERLDKPAPSHACRACALHQEMAPSGIIETRPPRVLGDWRSW